MLDELIVRNLGVLAEARLEPGPGFTVITGETGAGKTLLLGALRLLLGQAARPDLIGPFGDEAVAEGRFVTGTGEFGAGRRMTSGGRSRAYLDGSIASAAALDDATDGLIEIVGQHDHLLLTKPGEARRLVDHSLSDSGRDRLAAYRRAWDEVARIRGDIDQIGGDVRALERQRDLLRFQAREIGSAGFEVGDEEALDIGLARLRNSDSLNQHLNAAAESVSKARDRVGSAVAELRRAGQLDPSLSALLATAEALEADTGELTVSLRVALEDLAADPDQLEKLEARLRELNDLRRKYGPNLEDVMAFHREAVERETAVTALLGRAGQLENDVGLALEVLEQTGKDLRAHREEAGARLAEDAARHLVELGFVAPHLSVAVEPAPPARDGADSVTLRFASDERLTPGDISRVASGGELSRLVLALRLAGGAGGSGTVVFDEIDAGVGGATALAVGRKLAAVSTERQVLCVTHLPQVAAFADKHYVVERLPTGATVRLVNGDDRVEELSRMLAGLPDSERGREAAGELLELARTGF